MIPKHPTTQFFKMYSLTNLLSRKARNHEANNDNTKIYNPSQTCLKYSWLHRAGTPQAIIRRVGKSNTLGAAVVPLRSIELAASGGPGLLEKETPKSKWRASS